MPTIKKKTLLAHFLAKYKWRVLAVLIIGFSASVLKILIPISLTKYYSLVFESNSPKAKVLEFFPSYFTNTIPNFLLFFLMLILLTGLFDFLERVGKGVLGELFLFDLRGQLFKNQLRLKQSVYDEKGTGRYLLRYSGDLKSLQSYLTRGIIQFIIDILFLALTMSVLFIINPVICLIIAACIVTMLVVMVFVNIWLYNISMRRRNQKSNLLSYISIHLRSILSVRSFNKEKSTYRRYENRSKKILASGVHYHKVNSFIHALTKSSVYLMLAGILYFVHLSDWNSGSELLITVLLLVTILPLFRRTLRVYTIWQAGNISFVKLLQILNLPIEKQLKPEDAVQRIKGNRIIVKDLGVQLQGRVIFSDLSFTIPSQSITLITGSGKSTFAKILLGIYKDYTGKVRINKTDIKKIPPRVIRRKVTIASTDFPLYGRKVIDAITYNKKAKNKAAAAKLLEQLQQNWYGNLELDTPIGEMGQLLSYNQYTLLCFARAILTNKKIIIIDIQFRNLAPALQATLMQYINDLKQRKTIIILGQSESQLLSIKIDQKYTLNKPPLKYTLN